MRIRVVFVLIVAGLLVLGSALLAFAGVTGSLEPPGPPNATSSYTLEQVYERLESGAAGAQTPFTEPPSGPTTGTGHTLNEIMALAPALDDANGATQANVLASKTFWGLSSAGWGQRSGTMPDNGAAVMVPTTSNQAIGAGYHSGTGYVAGDADLVAGNVRAGVSLFGVNGACRGVPATGQTGSYGTGDDGAYQLGCAPAVTDPSQFHRGFSNHGNGTVTDHMTGLIWLWDANCFGTRTWSQALFDANSLASGICSLSDGSSAGDWRLPNVNELRSLIDLGQAGPALPDGHPFFDVQSSDYWTSTTFPGLPDRAYGVSLGGGAVFVFLKTQSPYVWPVRGGR